MRINEIITESEVPGNQLLKKFNGKKLSYAKLPKSAQDSLTQYMTIEGDNEDYQKQKYGYAEVPTQDIMKMVYEQNNEGQSFDDFWNVSNTLSFKPKYSKTSIWPIIWGEYGMEDGYHRLERYIKLKLPTIPVVICLKHAQVLDEITRPGTIDDAHEILKKAGYAQIGDGYYAEVFAKPGADHVLKLFNSRDKAYQAFVNLAIQNPNIHFPKFKGKMMKITDNYYAIRMEKLTPIAGISGSPRDRGIIKLMIEYITRKEDDPFRPFPDQRQMDVLEKLQPGITAACDVIVELLKHNDAEVDLHLGNVMMRGNTYVITDPVS